MEHSTEVFVGIDVSKLRNAIAVADGERGGEVRYLGEMDASEETMRRFVKKLAAEPPTIPGKGSHPQTLGSNTS